MEKCYYILQNDFEAVKASDCRRVYIGHETCEKRLPSFYEIKPILILLRERGIKLTLLIPFLTEKGLSNAKNLIDKLIKEVSELEVATSDWGLLHWVSVNQIAKPLAGRLLLGQKTDPRLSQFSFSDDIKLHLSSCTLLKKEVIQYLNQLGVDRFEISDSLFNLHLPDVSKSRFSLHIPYIPIAVMRWCIGKELNFNFINENCSSELCKDSFQHWETKVDRYNYFRIDNALFYKKNDVSDYSKQLSIDRIVVNYKYESA